MRKKKRAVIIFFLTLAVLYIIIYALPDVTGALKKTEIIEYGGFQVKDHVTAYIIRNENVYFANKSGNIHYYVGEGEQVRKGIKILDIISGGSKEQETDYQTILDRIKRFNSGESLFSDDIKRINHQIKTLGSEQDKALKEGETAQADRIAVQITRLTQKKNYIKATDNGAKEEIIKQNTSANSRGITSQQYISQSNGVISYYIDGYEAELTPENMALLTKKKIENLNIDVQNVTRKTTLAKEPLYKLVDNSKWYAVFWVAPENIVKYEKGKTAYIDLPLDQVEGKIYDIIDDDGQWMVIMEFNRYYKEFAQIRKVEADIITADYKGLTIPNESITTKDGQPGVYVKDKSGEYVFKPVKIITSDGEWSLVEVSYFYTSGGAVKVDTVNIYDEIIKKPKSL